MIDQLIDKMVDLVKQKGLELMSRYPADLLVHDRRFLQENLVEGVTIAWVVGNSHTHCALVGISEEQSDLIWHLSSLNESDVYCRIDVRNGKAAVKELSRQQFTDLSKIKPAYSARFDWQFDVRHGNDCVGHVRIEPKGSLENRAYDITVFPESNASAKDLVGLQQMAKRGAARQHGSLFWRGEIIVKSDKELCYEH
ncbi:hypothetical protein [Limnobacter alexandrii]|jgi:hypothetical protein|nr:hypothetical protein [Limnobacter alexandrii]